MSDRPRIKEKEKSIHEKLNDFIRSHRKIIISVIAVIFLAIIGLGIWTAVHGSIQKKSANELFLLEEKYEAYLMSSDADKNGNREELLQKADSIISRFSKSYAATRALLIKADVYYKSLDYLGAETAYRQIAGNNPKSHLAALSLNNAATMAEERGDREKALSYLEEALEKYPEASGINRVIFSIGRIQESQSQYDKAFESYTRLVIANTNDDWTKLARDRIIFMRAGGLIR